MEPVWTQDSPRNPDISHSLRTAVRDPHWNHNSGCPDSWSMSQGRTVLSQQDWEFLLIKASCSIPELVGNVNKPGRFCSCIGKYPSASMSFLCRRCLTCVCVNRHEPMLSPIILLRNYNFYWLLVCPYNVCLCNYNKNINSYPCFLLYLAVFI